MTKIVSALCLAGAAVLSVAGIVGFILIFLPGMNVFWLILAPIVFAVYQFPAVAVYSLWRRRRRGTQ